MKMKIRLVDGKWLTPTNIPVMLTLITPTYSIDFDHVEGLSIHIVAADGRQYNLVADKNYLHSIVQTNYGATEEKQGIAFEHSEFEIDFEQPWHVFFKQYFSGKNWGSTQWITDKYVPGYFVEIVGAENVNPDWIKP
ncbi:hypothetical protein D3C87_1020670 [compost metagenome]